jgi:hypothetical protein
MDPKVKEMWLNALRSGEYSQTQGHLKTPYGFCCLGVLCDLYSKEIGDTEWEKSEYYESGATAEYFEGKQEFLPESVVNWAGFVCEDPTIPSEQKKLSELNDEGMSFKEIADLIETHL